MSRIAFIAGTYLPASCSISDYTARLHASLRDRGVESVVLTTHLAAEAAYDPHAMGVVHGWRWFDLTALVRAVRESGADALHLQYHPRIYGHQPAILLLPLLLRLSGWRSPIVTTIHKYDKWEQLPELPSRHWWNRQSKLFLKLCNAAIAIAPEAKTLIQSKFNISKRLWYVPTATSVQVVEVERNLARQELRSACHWNEDTLVFVYFGFLYPGKGLETLLPAFKQVLATHPRSRLLIIGGMTSSQLRGRDATAYYAQLLAIVKELNLDLFVHFTGYLEAEIVSRYLTGADIGVLPSDRGVSLGSSSLIALLTHSLPTIATETQSIPATHPLVLVPPCNVPALATALTQLSRPEERTKKSEASRVFAQKFSWQNVAQQHLEIYQKLLIVNR